MDKLDLEHLTNSIGHIYTDIRKECLSNCANILETHDATNIEKQCMKNCFKKMIYAEQHFNRIFLDEQQ